MLWPYWATYSLCNSGLTWHSSGFCLRLVSSGYRCEWPHLDSNVLCTVLGLRAQWGIKRIWVRFSWSILGNAMMGGVEVNMRGTEHGTVLSKMRGWCDGVVLKEGESREMCVQVGVCPMQVDMWPGKSFLSEWPLRVENRWREDSGHDSTRKIRTF